MTPWFILNETWKSQMEIPVEIRNLVKWAFAGAYLRLTALRFTASINNINIGRKNA